MHGEHAQHGDARQGRQNGVKLPWPAHLTETPRHVTGTELMLPSSRPPSPGSLSPEDHHTSGSPASVQRLHLRHGQTETLRLEQTYCVGSSRHPSPYHKPRATFASTCNAAHNGRGFAQASERTSNKADPGAHSRDGDLCTEAPRTHKARSCLNWFP